MRADEINDEGQSGMPRTVWELYEFASATMLNRLDRVAADDSAISEKQPITTARVGGGSGGTGGHNLAHFVEAIFFQAHAAQARVILDEHLLAAALSLHVPAELAALQGFGQGGRDDGSDGLERVASSFKKPNTIRKRIEEAYSRLPGSLQALVTSIRERVVQDRLPLLSLLQPEPLQMQSSHLSFQEFHAARAMCALRRP